jgi:3-oxoadipate enol-lactonase
MVNSKLFKTRFLPSLPKIAFNQCGDGDLIIFIHGIGGNKENWHENMVVFSKNFNVVALDLRGYGESDDFEGPMNFFDVADDICELISYIGKKNCHVVGLSMGAQIALYFYKRYPSLTKSLVLCDAPLGFQDFTENEREKFIRLRRKPIEDGTDLTTMATKIADTLIGIKSNKSVFNQLVKSMQKLHIETYLKAIDSFVNSTHYNIFSIIDIPVLVVVGELDNLTPVPMAKEISAKIEGSIFEVIPNAGHLSNIENPNKFNKVVLSFLFNLVKTC